MLLGDSLEHKDKPHFPSGTNAWEEEHLAISKTMRGAGGVHPAPKYPIINLDCPPPKWVFDKTLLKRAPSGNQTYTQHILAHKLYPYYSVRPDLCLGADAIKNQKIDGFTFFKLDTEFDNGQGPQGGITSTPLVERSTPVKK